MSSNGHPESAVIIWRTEAGKTLWQLRDGGDAGFYSDHWGLFGGGLQAQESPTQAALRELKEETGLVPEMIWDLGDFSHPQLPLIHGFLVEAELDLATVELGEGADFGLFDDDEVLSGSLISPKTGKPFPVVGLVLDLFRRVKDNQFLRFKGETIPLSDS